MKGKLIKTSNGIYDLFEGTRFISTTDSPDGTANKLSLKNCQAIERGYDLDELVIDEIPDSSSTTLQVQRMRFIHGFEKALEILGDKKFSINEVVELTKILISNPFEKCGKTYQELIDSYIQSLQQTEWDVEIIEECLDKDCDSVDRKGDCITTGKPKLDAEGCLILKRI